MTTQFEIDCALMAGASYISTRPDINKFPIPEGWITVTNPDSHYADPSSGFEAVSFQRGNEIVISYAGTYDKDITGDWMADTGLATGFGSAQLLQAAEYYLSIKNDPRYQGTTITLTGHSLGGGLAALVGVFFGEKAVTFDQAPFANSAEENLLTPDVAAKLKSDLLLAGYSEDNLVDFTNFLQLREVNGGIPNSELVSNIRVDGEFLSSAPLSLYDPIGTTATVLDHGPYSSPSIDMHSMALLTAFLQSTQSVANSDNPQQTLNEVTKKLTNLLGMLFDSSLYAASTDTKTQNLLEHLVQHQEGLDPTVPNDGDAMVSRFTTDMWKIAQDGGLSLTNTSISKMLTAFAMQKYYEEPASGADHGETLFSDVTGGIRFNRTYVADTFDADSVKGYKYFQDYVGSLSFGSNREVFDAELPNLLDWYIQAGSQAMETTAGEQRAFMLGGSGDDFLTGGSQADLLVGNGGQDILDGGGGDDVLMVGWTAGGMLDSTGDTLYGGADNDRLYGGSGADILDGGADADLMVGGDGVDTYYIDGNDTIRDTGRNFIVYQGQTIAGAFLREGWTSTYRFLSDNNITLTFNSPGHMVLNGTDSIIFEQQTSAADFESGDFGITLYESVEAERTLTGTEERDWVTVMKPSPDNSIFGIWGGAGAISGDNIYEDIGYFGFFLPSTPVEMKTYGQGGNDLLYGLSGSDYIDGGDGDDVIRGEMLFENLYGEMGNGDILLGENGKDVILGTSGKDLVSGGADNDFLDGLNADDTIVGDGGEDVLAGGAGDDHLSGGAGNDYLCGDASLSVYGATRSILMNSETYEYWDADVSALGFHVTYGDKGYATSVALQGFDLFVYGAGSDQIFGGSGNDMLLGAGGNDTLLGEAEHDRLEGGEGDDYLDGGAGNDLLLGDDGDMTPSGMDTLYGGLGDDDLYGFGGDDVLNGGDDQDYLAGGSGNDTLLGGAGNDSLYGDSNDSATASQGDDSLHGGAGNDILAGRGGNDTYIFGRGDGQDTVNDSGGATDTIHFANVSASEVVVTRDQSNIYLAVSGTGDSLVLENWYLDNFYKIERLEFADGTTWDTPKLESKITVAPSSDTRDALYAPDSGGVINGLDGDDDLVGGKGNDTLYGGSGVDQLMGNAGDDTLVGGENNDFYMFNRGFGHDTVIETVADGDVDRVIFGGDIAPSDVYVYHDERNLYFSVTGTNDLLTLSGWFTMGSLGAGDDWAQYSQFMAVEEVWFVDGTIWDADHLKAIAASAPYTSALTLYGSAGADFLRGYIGEDKLYGGAGDDYIDGGAGDDMLYGQGDNDTILGGTGHDWLYGDDGDDILYGEDGDDVINTGSGNDIVYGGDGVDFISGGSGNNVLDGGDGRDDLRGGTGDDILLGGAGNDYIFSWLGNNTLDGGSGDDVLMGYDGNDIVIGSVGHDNLYGGAGDDVYVFGRGFGQDVIQEPDYSNWVNSDIGNEDTIRFIDGITLADVLVSRGIPGYQGEGEDIAAKHLCFSIKGTDDRVFVYGWFRNDYYKIEKVEFADGTSWDMAQILASVAPVIIEGNDQDNRYRDSLDGDITSDWIYGYGGNDSLNGSAGNDILDGGDGDDEIYGGSGDDALYGGAGDDNLEGGTGNDILVGGAGLDDLYGGDGDDILDGGAGNDFLEDDNGDDVFIFGRGYGQDLIYNFDYEQIFNDVIRFHHDVAPEDVLVARTDDGFNSLTLTIKGTEDVLTVDGFFDPDYGPTWQVDSVEFADGTVWKVEQMTNMASAAMSTGVVSVGTAEADTLTGTSGNDTLQGGADNDLLSGGDGNDTYIFNPGDGVDQIVDTSGTDTIVFGEGISPDSLSLGLGSLLVRVGDQGDAIHLENFNPDDPFNSSVIEQFQFVDGIVLDIGDLLARGFDIQGSIGDDLLTGTAITDRITGGEGNDTLAGGKGDDLLTGGGGNDTYVFSPGDGVDTIEDVSNAAEGNLIAFGAGIALSDLVFARDGSDLLIRVDSQDDTVRLKDFDRFGNNGSLVADTLQFADGSQASLFALTNTAPVVGVMVENQTAFEDAAYSFTIPADTFVDADAGDSLTYSATLGNSNALPLWLAFDPATRTFSGTPENDDVGFLDVTVSATDTAGAAVVASLALSIANVNDAPMVEGDSAFLIEDLAVSANGNVLANDSDVDSGTILAVADPAIQVGSYGTLSLTADGSYAYTLDTASGAVQSLGREAVVAEHFGYAATDGIVSVTSALDITLIGSNDAPTLVALLADQQVNFNKGFSWQLPVGSFVDPDQGDTLDYSATLADGSPLPTWLAFDAATQTFSGRAPKQVGAVEVKVTATDKVAVSGNTKGSLSASDVFQITISHGNEGVGNGEDAPPSGHDGNCNDGPGTGPGTPGRRRDHDDYRLSDKKEKRSDDLDNDGAWGQSLRVQPAYLNASHWDDKQSSTTTKSGEQVYPSVVFGRWLTMDLAVSTALADKKTLSWLDERLGADTTALNRASTGFLGSTTPFGADLFSLQAGHGQELTGFNGLGDGLWKVAS